MAKVLFGRDWGRMLTAMVTPFGSDGEVDYIAARKVAAYLVDVQKNDGVVVCGTTGESPTLSKDEKVRLVEEVKDEVGDRAAVVVGTGGNDTRSDAVLTERVSAIGVDGIMFVNPYYNKPSQDGLYCHFKTLAGCTDSSVMLYNIEPRSAVNLETSTLMKLAEIENVVAVKEASGDVAQIAAVCAEAPEGFRVYSGDDGLTLPLMSLGGYGLVSVAAHVAGVELKGAIEKYLAGDVDGALMSFRAARPAIGAVFCMPSPAPSKYLMEKRGLGSRAVRLPMVEVDAAAMAICDALG